MDSLTLNVDISSDPQKLDYALRLGHASQQATRTDTTFRLRRPSLVGAMWLIIKCNTRVAILGDSRPISERLALVGALSKWWRSAAADAYQFVAFADDQIINYDTWTAGANNYVRYNPDGTDGIANNLRLSNARSALVVQSQNPADGHSPLGVRFEQFELGLVSRAIGQPDSTLGGQLNGEALARNLGTKRQAFTANLTVKDLLFNKVVLGDLALQASNPAADRYDLTARLTGGGGNDATVRGTYRAGAAAPLDFVAEVARLNVRAAEPFSAGQISRSTGYLSGRLTVVGAVSAPQVRGQLVTSPDASFVVPQLGSPFRLVSQPIVFDSKGIAFNNFTVLDSAGHRAVANGYLLTKNLVDYAFDLRATTDKFLAVKNTRKNNSLYYGRLVVDSDTRLTGPLSLVKIDTRATVAQGSNLTVENPAADPSVVAREGIVQFVDKSLKLNPRLRRKVEVDSSAAPGGFAYDLTAQITLTDRTPFTFVVDPVSGDNLRVRAAGTLTFTQDASSNRTLTGRLDVTRGKYRLSLYGLATREFIISRGSSIVWSGDPYNADLNLTAIYKVKAAPADLLAAQGSNDPTATTVSRNALPFNVLLKVTDQLSRPTIGFDITLPDEQKGALGGEVEAQLARLRQPAQTSEQSKQVFSLLVLGRFIQQNPFQSAAGENLAVSQLRGSVSQVLTDQLQSLTGKYLAGLGLDLGVTNQADYATGSTQGRTDLNVAVRRQLFNNRLTVRLGTDVPLSGGTGNQGTQGTSAASNFAGDISLEYTLLADGRLRLRAFRQNAYEDIDGPIVRTGASLVFQRDYNDFQDLFAKVSRAVKQDSRQQRKQDKLDQEAQKRRDQHLTDSTAAANGAARVDTARRR